MVLTITAGQPAGALCAPPPSGCVAGECDVGLQDCGSGTDGGPGTPTGEPAQPGNPRPPILNYVPACPGNTPDNEAAGSCGAALTTCPDGGYRFFVYRGFWNPVSEAYGGWVRVAPPPSVCLSPEKAAAVDPLAGVLATVRSQWERFTLPGSVVVTRPAGQTLVGAVSLFSTPSSATVSLPPRDILGFSVTLKLTAVDYLWDFGDGTTVAASPADGAPATEHVYRQAGPMAVTLRTSYTATFTVAGSDVVYPLDGTAVVPGAPTELVAREARTQLEAGPR